MAKAEGKTISVKPSEGGFPRTMYFNRFSVDRVGPVRIFYFGLVDEEDYTRDLFACAIDEATLQRQKQDLLNYVGRASAPAPTDVPAWRPKVSGISGVQVANVLAAARTDQLAELRLFNYSQGEVVQSGKSGKNEVRAEPVALLRCEDRLQQVMLLGLYSEDRRLKHASERK
jgi:hypothetical protein